MPDHVRGRRAGRLCYGLGVWPAIALITLLCACRTDPLAGVLGAEAGRPFRVWVFTASTLAGPWARPSEPLASGLSSLGLHGEPDGGLAITGLPMGVEPGLLDELFPRLRVWGLVSAPALHRGDAARPDRWSEHTWELEDPDAVAAIDPQGAGGGFWYYAAKGRGGDPAAADGDHEIRSSPPASSRWTGPGLADPSPVMFHGEQILYATTHPDGVVAVAGGREITRLQGVTVPFALAVEEGGVTELILLAQAPVSGRRQPVMARSEDGRAFSAWSVPLDLGPLQSCTSPVLGRLQDGWMIACVEEPNP